MDNIFRRIKTRLRNRVESLSGKIKIVPYLTEIDITSPAVRSHSSRNNENYVTSFEDVNRCDEENTDHNEILFVSSLGIEATIRKPVFQSPGLCDIHPTLVAHYRFSRNVYSGPFPDLLDFLNVRNIESSELKQFYPVLKIVDQLNRLLHGIYRIQEQSLKRISLSLCRDIGAVLDMTLEGFLIVFRKIPLETAFVSDIGKLLGTVQIILPHIDFYEAQTRVVWCQTCTKASQLLQCALSISPLKRNRDVHSNLSNNHDNEKDYKTEKVPLETRLQSVTRALKSASAVVILMRDLYGLPHALEPIMAFWTVCNTCLNIISEALFSGQVRMVVARMCASAVYQLISMTSPSPQDLSALVHSPQLTTTSADFSLNCSLSESRILKPSSNCMTSPSPLWKQISYVIVGLQFLIHGTVCGDFPDSSVRSLSQLLPRQSEWTVALHDALMASLQPNASDVLKEMSSVLGELLFLCLLAQPSPNERSCVVESAWDYIYSDLAEHLTKFSDSWLKKNNFVNRLNQMSTSINSRFSGRPPSNGTHNSCRSVDSSVDITQSRPRKFSTGGRVYSPHIAARESAAQASGESVYTVGDNVDSLCTVQNGSQRWFPGTITSRALQSQGVNNESKLSFTFTYSILFTDGDKRENVSACNIRMTKNRSRISSRISTGRVDLSQSTAQDISRDTDSRKDSYPASNGNSPSSSTSPLPKETFADFIKPQSQGVGSPKSKGETFFQSEDRISGSSEDDEEDNGIFEIPMVLSRPSSSNTSEDCLNDGSPPISLPSLKSGIVVPRMHFENLDLSSAVDHGVGGSLSGSLLRESSKGSIFEDTTYDARCDASSRGTVDKAVDDYVKDDSLSSITRVESWRDSAGWTTRRSSGYGLPKSGRMPSHSSSSSLASLMQISNTQSSQDALKLIQVAVNDVTMEIKWMNGLSSTFETIVNILLYRVLSEPNFRRNIARSTNITKSVDVNNSSESTSTPSRAISLAPDYAGAIFDSTAESIPGMLVQQLLFGVRVYLSLDIDDISIAKIMSTSSYIGPAATRLLKLSSPAFFSSSCLPSHTRDCDKIASGSFGNVYRVKCPAECLYSMSGKNELYAVKRVTRERSIHDSPIIFDVFSEITCLEVLANNRGVCDLVNFGVHESEFWIVMEQGKCDMKDWIMRMAEIGCCGNSSLAEQCSAELSPIDELILKLCVFAECVSIVSSVHAKRIVHFDIKCSNFIIRNEPQLNQMIDAVLMKKLSGSILLGDFGESIHLDECNFGHKLMKRSRGTLPIQSPEMLSTNEGFQGIRNGRIRVNLEDPSYGCDVWSLGCMLFELETGKFLFENKSWTELFCMLCVDKFTPPDVVAQLKKCGTEVELSSVESSFTLISSIVEIALQQVPEDRTSLVKLEFIVQNYIRQLLSIRSIKECSMTLASITSAYVDTIDSHTATSNSPLGVDEPLMAHHLRPATSGSALHKYQRDTVVACEGSWLVGTNVAFSIGPSSTGIADTSELPITICELSNSSNFNTSFEPSVSSHMITRIPGVFAIPDHLSSADKTPHPCVMNRSSVAIKQMTMRCIWNHFKFSFPALSFVQTITNGMDYENISTIRIAPSRTKTCDEMTRGYYCYSSKPGSQHDCFLHDEMDFGSVVESMKAALKFSLSEIRRGRCVAVYIDTVALKGDKSVGSKGLGPSSSFKNSATSQSCNSVSSRLCITVGVLIACSTHFAADGSCIPAWECMMGIESKISILTSKLFPWMVPLLDIDLYNRLCGCVFNRSNT